MPEVNNATEECCITNLQAVDLTSKLTYIVTRIKQDPARFTTITLIGSDCPHLPSGTLFFSFSLYVVFLNTFYLLYCRGNYNVRLDLLNHTLKVF